MYHNELIAKELIHIFPMLSLTITLLGLIVIMDFIIKRKTKEIGLCKVNGATSIHILLLLNKRFIIWIGMAFLVALPLFLFYHDAMASILSP